MKTFIFLRTYPIYSDMKINVFIKCRVLPPLFSWLYKNEYRMPAKMPKNAFPLTSAIKDIFQSTSWEDPAGRLPGSKILDTEVAS